MPLRILRKSILKGDKSLNGVIILYKCCNIKLMTIHFLTFHENTYVSHATLEGNPSICSRQPRGLEESLDESTVFTAPFQPFEHSCFPHSQIDEGAYKPKVQRHSKTLVTKLNWNLEKRRKKGRKKRSRWRMEEAVKLEKRKVEWRRCMEQIHHLKENNSNYKCYPIIYCC